MEGGDVFSGKATSQEISEQTKRVDKSDLPLQETDSEPPQPLQQQPPQQQQQQLPLQQPPQYHEINFQQPCEYQQQAGSYPRQHQIQHQGTLQQQPTTTYPKQQQQPPPDQTNYSYGQNLNKTLINPIMEQPQPQQFGGPRVQQVNTGPPPSYMALSIFVCLCCCWPIGIAAIIASNEVDNAYAAQNYDMAEGASKRAKWLAISGIICGIVSMTVIIVYYMR